MQFITNILYNFLRRLIFSASISGVGFRKYITKVNQENFDNPKFQDFFDSQIKPLAEFFEEQRKVACEIYRRRRKIALPCFYLLVAIIIFMISHFQITLLEHAIIKIIMVIIILIFLGFYHWVYYPKKYFNDNIKFDIFKKFFKFYNLNYAYQGMDADYRYNFNNLNLKFNIASTEDFVIGKYKNVDLEFQELTLERQSNIKNLKGNRTTDSNFNTALTLLAGHTATIFHGLVILVSMNKNFSGKTVVLPNNGAVGNFFKERFVDKMQIAKLEDPEFEKMFQVFTTDQIEARFLLTTSFMERIKKLSEIFDGAKIKLSFYNNKLLILIPTSRNLFEVSDFEKPINFVAQCNLLIAELELIFSVIDELKLNINLVPNRENSK